VADEDPFGRFRIDGSWVMYTRKLYKLHLLFLEQTYEIIASGELERIEKEEVAVIFKDILYHLSGG
jgi:hypothetical protein